MEETAVLNPFEEQENKLPPEKPYKKPFQWKEFLKGLGIKILIMVAITAFIVGFQFIFGAENSFVGVCIGTAIMMFLQIDLGYKTWQASITIPCLFLLVGVSIFAAQFNPFLGLLVHLAAVWLIMMLTTQKMVMKAYLPFMLCYVFLAGSPVQGAAFGKQMLALAAGGVLTGILYFIFHRKQVQQKSIFHVFSETRFASDRNKYVLRMMLAIAVSLFVAQIFHLPKGNWIAIHALSITQPVLKDSSQRMVYRFVGNVFGGLIYCTLFGLLVPQLAMVGMMLASLLQQYAKPYWLQQICITICALSGGEAILGSAPLAFKYRIFYACCAIGITLTISILSQMHLVDKINSLFQRNKVPEEKVLEPETVSVS